MCVYLYACTAGWCLTRLKGKKKKNPTQAHQHTHTHTRREASVGTFSLSLLEILISRLAEVKASSSFSINQNKQRSDTKHKDISIWKQLRFGIDQLKETSCLFNL